jgi:beta-N-acetylhexosaminidase
MFLDQRLEERQHGNPGTLSADILDGLLRKQLKFDGVIFTDDMQMHAITKHYGLEEAIKLAINGGVDIMTFSNNIQGSDQRTVDKVHSIVKNMVKQGVITEARIDESYDRIMKLKQGLAEGDVNIYYQQALEKSNRALDEAKRQIEAAKQSIEQVTTSEEVQTEEPTKKKKKKKRQDRS